MILENFMQEYYNVRDCAEARSRGGLKITLAWCLVILMAMTVYMTLSALDYLFDLTFLDSDPVYYGIMGGVIALFVLPAACGINALAYGLYRGEECYVSRIFTPYKNLPRTWLIMVISLFPAAFAGGSVYGIVVLWRQIGSMALVQRHLWLYAVMCVAMLAAGTILLWLSARIALRFLMFFAYAFRGDMSLSRALGRSHRAATGRMWAMIRFLLSYVGWLLLDVATLGVLWLMHTAPRFALDYIKYSDTLLEREYDNE